MIGLAVGLLVACVITASVWVTTEDVGDTAQLGSGLTLLTVAAYVSLRRLGELGESERPSSDHSGGPVDPSASWLWTSMTAGGSSEWHVHTRARPAARELAAVLAEHRHGLDLHDPACEAELRNLVGEAAWEILRPDRPTPDRDSRRRDGTDQLESLLSGLESL